ncbi:MAG: efflux RND transporter periplasmic adaptor subunit [Chloroflexota bacterium]
MRWIKWLAVVTMFAVGFGAVFVSTVGLGDTQAATTGYLTQAARLTNVAQSSAATGTVTSAASYALGFGEEPRLATEAAGGGATDSTWMVDQVLVSVGDRVTVGQPLATADTSDVQADVAQANASLALARITLSEAERTLGNAKSDARAQLTDAKTALDAAKLSLKNAQVQRSDAADGNPKRQARIAVIGATDKIRATRRLQRDLQIQFKGDFPVETIAVGEAEEQVTTLESQIADLTEQLQLGQIVAPVDGIVTGVNIEPGLMASSRDAIVLDSAILEVVADVVESDVSSLALGQTAMVSIDALELDVPGTVTSIAPSTDGGTSSVVTFPVTVTLIDPDPAIKPGMSTDVEITIAEAPGVVAVPVLALRGSQGAYTIAVASPDGGMETRQVTIGLVTESLAEVRSGILEGESVIVGTDTARVISDEQAGGFGGPGGFGGGFRGLQGGGGGFRGGGGRGGQPAPVDDH